MNVMAEPPPKSLKFKGEQLGLKILEWNQNWDSSSGIDYRAINSDGDYQVYNTESRVNTTLRCSRPTTITKPRRPSNFRKKCQTPVIIVSDGSETEDEVNF